MSPADRIIEATMPHTLRPKRGNREKVIAAALEFVIEEYGYYVWDFGYDSKDIIDVKDIRNLIEELRTVETLEELAHVHPQDPPDAL
jgi:hypothetical protein